ncbi:glycosyltransferase [Psychromarinibacter sp. C21-152]|uniref:Glycosyltransferase n=1 Tax=Psychromarinibacter sediminicola TaxID=3033385 RepID=A0AAE3NTK1_9RHOB|nr:glycosyltransferase [Psychromarinibacter sediminicola]MDF0602179.1 glycosyltransferase [Psychromarinibacter sediminicola]
MTAPAVSAIVVSRHRPEALLRCLSGIEQLDYPAFEVIVVADPSGLETLSAAGFDGRIKTMAFDAANISAARNLGLAQAAGEIVAFIDDDAVPEPTWLRHLAGPFSDATVAAAGGYVIGRNGISFQHRGRRVDATGAHRPLDLPGDAPQVFDSAPGDAVKTEGTNCAFRAEILRALGGFDPAFRFYLDETDVNLRLAAQRARTAIVPLAQVHHGFAASERRHASRLPRTLFDVGASQAVLLRRHAPARVAAALDAMRAEQRARLLRFMVAGDCEPRDVGRLLDTLEAGIAEGGRRAVDDPAPLPAPSVPFLQFAGRRAFSGMTVVAGRIWRRRGLRRAAAGHVAAGRRATLYLFSPTALFHRVRFHADGYWEQRGGRFGRSARSDPLFRYDSFRKRLEKERARTRGVRELP